MGNKDTVTKDFMQDEEMFADAFNFFIYGGRQFLDPKLLKALDTSSIVLPYGEGGKPVPVQKYRDILKIAAFMKGPRFAYLLLGIENQSQVHYAMPARNMLYDSIQYASQIEGIAKAHRAAGQKSVTSAEYLSGFHKTDKLVPVVTLTIYFGAERWDAPKSLYDMLPETDDKAMNFISNYRLNLIVPADISDADFSKFNSELSQVLKYIKYSQDKDKLRQVVEEDPAYRSVSRKAANMLNVVTGSHLKYNEGEERIDMCKAIEGMREDARAEGREAGIAEGRKAGIAEGREEGGVCMLASLVKAGIMTLADAAKWANLSVSEFEIKAAGLMA